MRSLIAILVFFTLLAAETKMAAADQHASSKRNPIMQITFQRGGGIGATLRPKVKGIIRLKDDASEVTSDSDSTYHRTLAPDEVDHIRAGADPTELTRAKQQVAANTAKSGDLDFYTISVTTKDGKTHTVDLNMSGTSAEMKNVSPAASKFLDWVRNEIRQIQAHGRGK